MYSAEKGISWLSNVMVINFSHTLLVFFPTFPFAQIVHYSQKDRHFSFVPVFYQQDQIEDMVIVGAIRNWEKTLSRISLRTIINKLSRNRISFSRVLSFGCCWCFFLLQPLFFLPFFFSPSDSLFLHIGGKFIVHTDKNHRMDVLPVTDRMGFFRYTCIRTLSAGYQHFCSQRKIKRWRVKENV